MINNHQIQEYLADFQKRDLPNLIERDLIVSDNNKIVTVIGPRRAGKTFFLFQLMKKKLLEKPDKREIIYLNFEDPRLINASVEEIREIIKIHWSLYENKGKYLFIDEPQNIEKWEVAVRSLHDEGFKIYITGSSSKFLSKEIATSLRGRALPYLLLPFSFNEFLKLKNKNFETNKMNSKEMSELFSLTNEFINFGSFPEIIKENTEEEKIRILNSYFELIVFKDIIDRYKIKNSKLIKWLIKTAISSYSNEISVNKIYQTIKSQNIKASKNTLYSYLSLLEDSFFILNNPKFLYSERKKDFIQSKIYLNDTGFVKLIELSKELDKKMENVIYLELIRRKKVLEEINYWKNIQQEEVDFVVSKSKKVQRLMQACYNINNPDTKKREVNALLKASKELKCKNLSIVTFDYEGEEECEWFGIKEKINFIPLWKWLLENNLSD